MPERCPKCNKYSVIYNEEGTLGYCVNYKCRWTTNSCPICFEPLTHIFGKTFKCIGCERIYNDEMDKLGIC